MGIPEIVASYQKEYPYLNEAEVLEILKSVSPNIVDEYMVYFLFNAYSMFKSSKVMRVAISQYSEVIDDKLYIVDFLNVYFTYKREKKTYRHSLKMIYYPNSIDEDNLVEKFVSAAVSSLEEKYTVEYHIGKNLKKTLCGLISIKLEAHCTALLNDIKEKVKTFLLDLNNVNAMATRIAQIRDKHLHKVMDNVKVALAIAHKNGVDRSQIISTWDLMDIESVQDA